MMETDETSLAREHRNGGGDAMSAQQPERGRDRFSDDLVAACEAALQRYYDGPLPFVALHPENPAEMLSGWSVEPTGDVVRDTAAGLVFAEMLVRRSRQFPPGHPFRHEMLKLVLSEMVKGGRVGPTEDAFLFRIALLAAAGAMS